MANQEKYTILYGRLSQEDDRDGTSNSIENQRIMLEKYAADNGFANTIFKFDDGYSGTNFNRPAWNEVMELAESDQVATIIVKDLSRLGREHIHMGQLAELIFPALGIRFIAINDGEDSRFGSNDFTPFKNLFNEFYAKDTSRKIRAVIQAKAERGERIGTRAPFGYRKREDDPKRIEPDPESAEIVRHIFALCVGGKGPNQIARQLEKEQVVNPSNYYFRKTVTALTNLDTTHPYHWKDTTVAKMLGNKVYIGHTANLKTTTVSYKNKKKIERPESEQLLFENTHEPLIAMETWDIVQELRKHKRRPAKHMETPNMFSGLTFCADCGAVMKLHRSSSMKEKQYNFMCRTSRQEVKGTCTAHYIREVQLKAVILDDLRRITHYARTNEKLFAEQITEKSSVETKREIVKTQREIDTATRRISELTRLFKRLYEDDVAERIPREQYRMLSTEYTSEQAELQSKVPELEARLEQLKNSLTNVERFIEKAKQYTEIKELTPELIRLFIGKIVIGEKSEKYSRNATQKIWIHYRDIGVLDKAGEAADDDEDEEFVYISVDALTTIGA